MLTIPSYQRAFALIRRYTPKFYFEISDDYDYPGSISFGDWLYEEIPSMYFSVMENTAWAYLLVCIYHRFDTKAPHEHDFTYIMLRVDLENETVFQRCSREHFDLNFEQSSSRVFSVAAKHHSIKLQNEQFDNPNFVVYDNWNFVNMRSQSFLENWDYVQLHFGENVLLPDLVNCRHLINWAKKHRNKMWIKKNFGLKSPYEMEGLLWRAPDQLFMIAEKAKRIKNA